MLQFSKGMVILRQNYGPYQLKLCLVKGLFMNDITSIVGIWNLTFWNPGLWSNFNWSGFQIPTVSAFSDSFPHPSKSCIYTQASHPSRDVINARPIRRELTEKPTCWRKVEMQSTVRSANIRPASVFNQMGRASKIPKTSELDIIVPPLRM